MQKNMQDAYGYVKNGLIEQANDLEDLMQKIEEEIDNRQPVFQKAQYYNALVGTENEGKSGALAGAFIRDFLNENF